MKKLLTVLFATQVLTGLTARETSVNAAVTVDWEDAAILIQAEVDFSSLDTSLPSARSKARELIADELPAFIQRAMYPLPYDSGSLVRDEVLTNSKRLGALEDFSATAENISFTMDTSLSTMKGEFRLSMFPGLYSIFVDHVHAYAPERLLSFVPTTTFTGIVIYAKGNLPVHGEEQDAPLSPGLFPKIYDENMNLVFEARMMPPEYLTGWGPVKFTASENLTNFRGRIGDVPLITMAHAVFGTNRTDIVISEEAAGKILYSKENIELLQEGRILVICDLR